MLTGENKHWLKYKEIFNWETRKMEMIIRDLKRPHFDNSYTYIVCEYCYFRFRKCDWYLVIGILYQHKIARVC